MKVKVTFLKSGNLVYLSQLNLYILFSRAIRRSGLPFAASQGFRPRVKISFLTPALKIGSFCCEEAVFSLRQDVPLAEFAVKMREVLPQEIFIIFASRY